MDFKVAALHEETSLELCMAFGSHHLPLSIASLCCQHVLSVFVFQTCSNFAHAQAGYKMWLN